MKKLIQLLSYLYVSLLLIMSIVVAYLITRADRFTTLGNPFTYIQIDFTQRSSLLTILAIGAFILGNVLMLLKKEYKD